MAASAKVFCCWVFWPANACLCMRSLLENDKKAWKLSKLYVFYHAYETCKPYVEIWRKQSFLAFRSDSQTQVETQKQVAPKRFWVNFTSFAHGSLVTMMKNTVFNLSGATSIWVSTNVWESLLNAKNVSFLPYFYVSLRWTSCTHDEKRILLIILRMRLLVEIHNI